MVSWARDAGENRNLLTAFVTDEAGHSSFQQLRHLFLTAVQNSQMQRCLLLVIRQVYVCPALQQQAKHNHPVPVSIAQSFYTVQRETLCRLTLSGLRAVDRRRGQGESTQLRPAG